MPVHNADVLRIHTEQAQRWARQLDKAIHERAGSLVVAEALHRLETELEVIHELLAPHLPKGEPILDPDDVPF